MKIIEKQTEAMTKLTKEFRSAKSIGVDGRTLSGLARKGVINRKSYYRCGYEYVQFALKS